MRRARRQTEAVQISVPAPIDGIIENEPSPAKGPLAAEWIENFLPTVRGLRVRGGTRQHADVNASVVSMFVYDAGNTSEMFAATANAIFEVTTSTTDDTPLVSAMTGGNWTFQQFGTTGGDFLIGVNGEDTAQLYDGTTFAPLTDEAVNSLAYDALTADFAIGETVTGGTSSASAEILGIARTTATTGTLYVGAVTGGPFSDDETITSATGSATANGTNASVHSLAISGVATNTLGYVWTHKNRLYFAEKNSLKAWYMPSGAIGGTALDIDLTGVFQRGGSILFGSTWSLDSGDGLDDKWVVVTTQGEVAVYSGTDPSSASTWSLDGRYDIGAPLGRHGHIRVGGDLLIATDDGVVPLSTVFTKDASDLSLAAVSRGIRTTWAIEANRATSPVQLLKWTAGELMIAFFPEATRVLTANLQTSAWAIQTGWNGNCAVTFNGKAYVGQSDGIVKEINSSGADMDAAFTASVCCAFREFGDPLRYKAASMCRGAFFADSGFEAQYGIAVDYNVEFPDAPLVSAQAASSDSLIWGTGNWGEKNWALEIEDPTTGVVDYWSSVAGAGYAVAPTVQITSGGADRLAVELARVDFMVEGGGRAA